MSVLLAEETFKMARPKHHKPEQIILKLEKAYRRLYIGQNIAQACQALEVAESTLHRWRHQYGGMKANEAKRLKELELEHARLKKLLAEAELGKSMLKDLAEGNF